MTMTALIHSVTHTSQKTVTQLSNQVDDKMSKMHGLFHNKGTLGSNMRYTLEYFHGKTTCTTSQVIKIAFVDSLKIATLLTQDHLQVLQSGHCIFFGVQNFDCRLLHIPMALSAKHGCL